MNKVRFLATATFHQYLPYERKYPCEIVKDDCQNIGRVRVFIPSAPDKYFNYYRRVLPEQLSNIHMVLVTDDEANKRIDEMLKNGEAQ